MLRSILIGLDGSASSFDALLIGLGIIDEPTICRPEPTGIGGSSYKKQSDSMRLADARKQVKGFLEQFTNRCANVRVACQVIEDVGRPDEQILQEGHRFDAILLGQRPRFHFETQERDTETLRKVLRGGSRPVVVVPEQLPEEGAAILVAYDGSSPADRALQAIQTSGLAEGLEVHVVCVGAEREVTERLAGQAVEYLRFHAIEAKACPIVTPTKRAQVLLDQVQVHSAGLLVMGAYGQPRLRQLLLGSLTHTMVKQSSVPLFMCH
jgi:nucleotide-binding universal stress UspA family protein